MSPGHPWTLSDNGLVVLVRLTPKGGQDAIDGVARLADGRCVLKARVRAAASGGEANAALIGLLARRLDVPARTISLASGLTARLKRVRINGEPEWLAAKFERIVAA